MIMEFVIAGKMLKAKNVISAIPSIIHILLVTNVRMIN